MGEIKWNWAAQICNGNNSEANKKMRIFQPPSEIMFITLTVQI